MKKLIDHEIVNVNDNSYYTLFVFHEDQKAWEYVYGSYEFDEVTYEMENGEGQHFARKQCKIFHITNYENGDGFNKWMLDRTKKLNMEVPFNKVPHASAVRDFCQYMLSKGYKVQACYFDDDGELEVVASGQVCTSLSIESFIVQLAEPTEALTRACHEVDDIFLRVYTPNEEDGEWKDAKPIMCLDDEEQLADYHSCELFDNWYKQYAK